MKNKQTFSALLLSALILLTAIPTHAAQNMGDGSVVTAPPDATEHTIVIEGEKYDEAVGENVLTQEGADGEITYVYLKASDDDTTSYAQYDFDVAIAGEYSCSFALRTKSGNSLRDGMIVLDGAYEFYVARTDTDAQNTVEYVTGYDSIMLSAGHHEFILYLSPAFDDDTHKSIHLDKIILTRVDTDEATLEIESAEAETTIPESIPETAPQTADTTLFLSIPTLCSVITLYLISKRRAK